MSKKIPVQKGPIEVSMETYKNATHEQKVKAREQELRGLESGKNMTEHMSKG